MISHGSCMSILRHCCVLYMHLIKSEKCLPNFWFAVAFWLGKVTTDSHILAKVNTESPDDWYT